nr:uncharacterized protein C17orf67 homolog isoform X2 [Gorilla gorilla gorilla]
MPAPPPPGMRKPTGKRGGRRPARRRPTWPRRAEGRGLITCISKKLQGAATGLCLVTMDSTATTDTREHPTILPVLNQQWASWIG